MIALRRYLLGLAVSLVLVGATMTAHAAFLFTDGDFDAQTIGSPVGAPWAPVGGGNTVTADAQSPYVNVYPNNGKGANFPASAGNPYIVRTFADQAIPSTATGLYYFNVDFRNNTTDPGDYSITITHDANGAVRSVAFYVTGDTLYAESGDGTEAVTTLTAGTWYNLQVTLDLTAKTYSGSIATPGGAIPISSRPFVNANQAINCVYTDGGTSYVAGTAPDHDVDNWAISDTPLTVLASGAYVNSTAPVGKAVDQNAPIVVELQDHDTVVVTNTIVLTVNGQSVVPTISKPADITTITYAPPTPWRPGTYAVGLSFADNATPPSVKTNSYSFTVPGPALTSASPVGAGFNPDVPIQIELTDVNTQVAQNSIQLFVNDQAVTPQISKPAGSTVTTVTYSQAGGYTSGSTNTCQIIFSDTSTPPIFTTNSFSFSILLDPLVAAAVINIDFKGVRNNPGPDVLEPTYQGVGAGGGGRYWNGIIADSRLPDGLTDDDNLTVGTNNMANSLGDPTTVSFTVSPVGGDVGGPPTTNPTAPEALYSDYIFNNSAGNTAGESPWEISGLGNIPFVDLYFYRTSGGVTIPGASQSPFVGQGIFNSGNTYYYSRVPVTNGIVDGTMGSGTAVIEGITIVKPLPRPYVASVSPTGRGVALDTPISIQVQDYVSQVASGSVQLLVNGSAVTASVSKSGGLTTVSYNSPAGGWAQGSTNTFQITFSDNATPPVVQSNTYTFVAINLAKAGVTINIDITGARSTPTPHGPGITYVGQGIFNSGSYWNSVFANSQLPDGTDDDLVTASTNNLANSLGQPTTVSFTVSPVGGDAGATGTDPTAAAALFNDYLFVGTAGQYTGLADFSIDGLGSAPFVDLYLYGNIPNFTVAGATPTAFAGSGIFTSANTFYYHNVAVTNGTVTGTVGIPPGSGTTVVLLYGLTIQKPLPQPYLKSFAPTLTPGFKLLTNQVGTITIQLQDYVSQVVSSSIQLLLNGQAVTPQVTQQSGVTTISYNPAGALQLDANNSLRLVFSDNASPAVSQTNDFSIPVMSNDAAAKVLNIDFNGARTPDVLGPTYSGLGAASGGTVWNGITADSRVAGGTDNDNLTVGATNMVDSLGDATAISFTISPVGGDVGGAPTTDPTSPDALLGDYIFNNSAGNTAGESPFTISGLGQTPTVDLYFYKGPGTITVPGSQPGTFTGAGIFTPANTVYLTGAPVTDGKVQGTMGGGTCVIYGMTMVLASPSSQVGPLSVALQAGNVVISWIGPGTLQSADEVTGPWSDVDGATSPVTITSLAGHKFYRLRQ
ncbi:MAG: hypothetical protein M1608_12260 [Candidatus Omnitrophica bacterium]|nr:hypothetical protein [Candidatus Omnitrophota bacterium]